MTRLTPRQREVAELVGDGLPYKAIAEQLHIGHDRVWQHVEAIARKVGGPDNDLEPRDTVFLWVRQRRWEAARLAQQAKLPSALTESARTETV